MKVFLINDKASSCLFKNKAGPRTWQPGARARARGERAVASRSPVSW